MTKMLYYQDMNKPDQVGADRKQAYLIFSIVGMIAVIFYCYYINLRGFFSPPVLDDLHLGITCFSSKP